MIAPMQPRCSRGACLIATTMQSWNVSAVAAGCTTLLIVNTLPNAYPGLGKSPAVSCSAPSLLPGPRVSCSKFFCRMLTSWQLLLS